MNAPLNGELVPVGGGDPIPLLRDTLVLGRRESCDVVLRFSNVSGQHCELTFRDGLWHLKDLNSTNGTKVNGQITQQKVLRPGDEITIAKRRFTIEYTLPPGHGAFADFMEEEDIGLSLLEKAGLERPPRPKPPVRRPLQPEPEVEDDE
jgi:adenylate cyclase